MKFPRRRILQHEKKMDDRKHEQTQRRDSDDEQKQDAGELFRSEGPRQCSRHPGTFTPLEADEPEKEHAVAFA